MTASADDAPAPELVITYDVESPMRDGLSRTPYGRDGAMDAMYFDVLRAVRRGYVVIRQDVRGRYGSDGVFTPSLQEGTDGYDSVQWAAGLPYCDGTVGMWGKSYFAETQWRAALEQPPALGALVPTVSASHEWLDGGRMRGGAHELGSRWIWAHGPIGPDLLARRHGDDPAALRAAMGRLVADLDRGARGGVGDAVRRVVGAGHGLRGAARGRSSRRPGPASRSCPATASGSTSRPARTRAGTATSTPARAPTTRRPPRSPASGSSTTRIGRAG